MADDLHNRGPADRSKINVHEPWEVTYWSTQLGVSPTQLRNAVAAVGTSVAAVRRHLGK